MRWGHGGRDTRLHLLSPGRAEQALCPSPRGQSQAEIPLPRTTEQGGPRLPDLLSPWAWSRTRWDGAGHTGSRGVPAPADLSQMLTVAATSSKTHE